MTWTWAIYHEVFETCISRSRSMFDFGTHLRHQNKTSCVFMSNAYVSKLYKPGIHLWTVDPGIQRVLSLSKWKLGSSLFVDIGLGATCAFELRHRSRCSLALNDNTWQKILIVLKKWERTKTWMYERAVQREKWPRYYLYLGSNSSRSTVKAKI